MTRSSLEIKGEEAAIRCSIFFIDKKIFRIAASSPLSKTGSCHSEIIRLVQMIEPENNPDLADDCGISWGLNQYPGCDYFIVESLGAGHTAERFHQC
jgi:hypothetical protein